MEDNNLTAEYFREAPPGYYFRPTDQELILEYLNKKINGQTLPINRIFDVNVYQYHPRDLCEMYELIRGDAWFFFTSLNKKYPNGGRPNRAAGGTGYWKATGADKDIIEDNGIGIGKKKTLVYYEGSAGNGVKTNWIMHEFRSTLLNPIPQNRPNHMLLDQCVLCRIYEKLPSNSTNNNQEGQQHNLVQNIEENLPIAPIDNHQHGPPPPPPAPPLPPPPPPPQSSNNQVQLHQIMASDSQNPLLASAPHYQSPLPAAAPPGLPPLPPTFEDAELYSLMLGFVAEGPSGSSGFYDNPSGPLGFYENAPGPSGFYENTSGSKDVFDNSSGPSCINDIPSVQLGFHDIISDPLGFNQNPLDQLGFGHSRVQLGNGVPHVETQHVDHDYNEDVSSKDEK